MVSHVFSVCTPYSPPHQQYISTEDLAKGPLPQFGYQLQLASGEVEKFINDEQSIRQFCKGMFGGRGPKGESLIIPEKGLIAENLPLCGESKLLSGEVSSDISIHFPSALRQIRGYCTDQTRCSTTMSRSITATASIALVSTMICKGVDTASY